MVLHDDVTYTGDEGFAAPGPARHRKTTRIKKHPGHRCVCGCRGLGTVRFAVKLDRVHRALVALGRTKPTVKRLEAELSTPRGYNKLRMASA